MGYGGSSGTLPGMKLVKAPKAKKPPKAKAAPKPKPPCKYGPRTKAGKCPKKPKSLKEAVKRDLESGVRPGTGGSSTVALAEKAAQKAVDQAATRLGTKVAGAVGKAADQYSKARAAGAAGTAVGAASAAQLTGVALAGLGAYWITSKILEARQAKRTKRADLAAAAADAYRLARQDAVKKQKGKPLTAQQHAALAAAFKAELKKLGLSTTDLGGL